jgi:hypothetical protein
VGQWPAAPFAFEPRSRAARCHTRAATTQTGDTMKLKAKKQEEAVVDMTPMIDCVFLLIIFFMIV